MPDGKSRVVYVWQSYDRKSAAGTFLHASRC